MSFSGIADGGSEGSARGWDLPDLTSGDLAISVVVLVRDSLEAGAASRGASPIVISARSALAGEKVPDAKSPPALSQASPPGARCKQARWWLWPRRGTGREREGREDDVPAG